MKRLLPTFYFLGAFGFIVGISTGQQIYRWTTHKKRFSDAANVSGILHRACWH